MSQAQPDYLGIVVSLFTISGSIVAFVAGLPRLFRWLNRPSLKIEHVRIFYRPLANSSTVYSYQEAGKGHAVNASMWVESIVANSKRRWKRAARATGIRWAMEISHVGTHTQMLPMYVDTQFTILGPGSRLPISYQITIDLYEPKYRVYLHVVCDEGSSAIFDQIVEVIRFVV